MRKDFGSALREQPREIEVLFAIGSGRQFEHVFAAGAQPVRIARRRRFG
jgi:hypothetical protein